MWRTLGLGAIQSDLDEDRLGDDWEEATGYDLDTLEDFDLDGLKNIDEFLWLSNPLEADTDNDQWGDRAEALYWAPFQARLLPIPNLGLLGPTASTGTGAFLDTDGDHLMNMWDPDSDNDGLLDGLEALWYLSKPELTDTDGDGLIDGGAILREGAPYTRGEVIDYGTDPTKKDSDNDGLDDPTEIQFWESRGYDVKSQDSDEDGLTNVLDSDSDNDGLGDGDEVILYATDPELADTDNDGMPDRWEVENGLRPTIDDAALDADVDGLSNLGEYQHGTDPQDPDTEGDELQDGPEIMAGTNPFHWDTDGDSLPDAWEDLHKYLGPTVVANPVVSDANADVDNDSFGGPWCANSGQAFTNRAEYQYDMPSGWDSRPTRSGGDGVWWGGTAPNDADTDDDGLGDGYEVCSRTDPNQIDFLGTDDLDADGLANSDEETAGTRLEVADTDGDGLCDGGRGTNCTSASGNLWPGERDYNTNPLQGDTDYDSWTDGPEAFYWDPAGTGSVPDSDGDGHSNLHESDSDGDGRSDHAEYLSNNGPEGSDPGKADTDDDSLSDSVEYNGWTLCLNKFAGTCGSYRNSNSNPQLADTDIDGLTDPEERSLLTDPRAPDTDGDGLTDAQEITGWVVVVEGVARDVTSNPSTADSDWDGLPDGIEFAIGTDPRQADTDLDGLSDSYENEDLDENIEEGETSPLDPDSDDDGLSDGLEELQYLTDSLFADSDEDGLGDGDEVLLYGTSPLNHDTDDDFLPDGEELGIVSAGGRPDRITDPLSRDTDDDRWTDGHEVYFTGTDPLLADTDCDSYSDFDDSNPYISNYPPGTTRRPEDPNRTCIVNPGAPAMNTGALSASASEQDAGDVGLLIFDEQGTITILARAPESETSIVTVQAVMRLEGQVRTDASGTLASASAHITAELQTMDEVGADESTNPPTHSVRVALPEGMVSATSATFALTFMDANLNSATYTGEATGFQLDEVAYEDELTAADEQDWNDPSDSTADGSGWDYKRGNLTGGEADASVSASAMSLGLPGLPDWSAPPPSRIWLFRITQPDVPSLVGTILDGAFALVAPTNDTVPFKAVLFSNTIEEVDPDEYHSLMNWNWKGPVKALKKVVQATSKVWSATVSVATTAASIYNQYGQVAKSVTLGIYDDLRNPTTPTAYAARFVVDIIGIGDVIDIVEGVREGDWAQVGLGVACLALTVFPMLKGPVVAAKTSMRVAKAAGASDGLLKVIGKGIGELAQDGATAAPKIDRITDALHIASSGAGKNAPKLDGLEVLTKVETPNAVGTTPLANTNLKMDFLAREAAGKSKAGAVETAKAFPAGSQIDLDAAARVGAKFSAYTPEGSLQVIDDIGLLNKGNVNGLQGIVASAEGMATPQAKGHLFTIQQVAKKIRGTATDAGFDAGKVDLGYSYNLASGKTIRPDAFYDGPVKVFSEYKNYEGTISLTKFNKLQMQKYRDLVAELGQSEAHYIIKNGQASGPFKALAKEYGIKLFDGNGVPIL